MSDNEILTLLKQNNPFISRVSTFIGDSPALDLLQLNREVYENIEQLIRHKRREPNLPLAGLILGEHGTGKTNMLVRILRKLKDDARPIILINVRAFKDPKTAVQHLLNEIFISLRQIHSKGRTQFDVVMDEFINSFIEKRRNDGFSHIDNIDKKAYIARDIPQIDRKFLKSLIAYVNSNDFAVKDEILEWFLNGLDEEDSHELGLPIRNLDNMDDVQREQEAERVLIFLGHVLAYAKVTMIICFDELDLIRDKNKDRDLIISWENIISFLVNNLFGILPLCFMKPESWNDCFKLVLDPAVVDRFSKNTMALEKCSIEQAQKLIFLKIKSVVNDDKTAEEVYKWLLERMQKTNNILTEGLSPRKVMELANRSITGDISLESQIKSVYDEEYKKVQANPSMWPPNADQLAFALEFFLKSHEGFDFYSSNVDKIKLMGIYKDKIKFAFVFVTLKNTSSASSGLKKGINFLNENADSFCCYISESSVYKFRTWTLTNQIKTQFENLGGHVIFLDKKTRVEWYALTALINRIDNGDVNLYSSSGNRTATRNDIKNFVKNIKLIDFPFDKKSDVVTISPKPQPVLPEDKIIDELKIIINTSPMNIISVSKAIEFLSQKNFHVEKAKVLALIQSNKNIFKTFNSKNELLLTLTNRK